MIINLHIIITETHIFTRHSTCVVDLNRNNNNKTKQMEYACIVKFGKRFCMYYNNVDRYCKNANAMVAAEPSRKNPNNRQETA